MDQNIMVLKRKSFAKQEKLGRPRRKEIVWVLLALKGTKILAPTICELQKNLIAKITKFARIDK